MSAFFTIRILRWCNELTTCSVLMFSCLISGLLRNLGIMPIILLLSFVYVLYTIPIKPIFPPPYIILNLYLDISFVILETSFLYILFLPSLEPQNIAIVLLWLFFFIMFNFFYILYIYLFSININIYIGTK